MYGTHDAFHQAQSTNLELVPSESVCHDSGEAVERDSSSSSSGGMSGQLMVSMPSSMDAEMLVGWIIESVTFVSSFGPMHHIPSFP